MSYRVVVTGLGAICALGNNINEYKDNLWRGYDGITPINPSVGNLTGVPHKYVAAQIKNYSPEQHFDSKKIIQMDRCSQLGVLAAREAIADAGLTPSVLTGPRIAVVVASGIGGHETMEAGYYRLYRENKHSQHPFTIAKVMSSGPTSHITMEHGITGGGFAISSACASSAHAIGVAKHWIETGLYDVVLVGGSEACLTYGMLCAWYATRALSLDTCRPFSKDRKGMVLGEGAGILILESHTHATQRGVKIYAEIAGHGMSSDARDLMQPSLNGMILALERSFDDAGIGPDDIDYVNAHGTGTQLNDKTETQVLQRVLGKRLSQTPVSSTKSMHGHTLGAAGSLEAIASILSIQDQKIPPTIHFNETCPDCDLDCVPNKSRNAGIDVAISNSFAFGGLNSVLTIRSWQAH